MLDEAQNQQGNHTKDKLNKILKGYKKIRNLFYVVLLKVVCFFLEVLGMSLRSLHSILLGCCLGNLIHLLGQVTPGTV